MTIRNKTSKLNKTRTVLLVFALLGYGHMIQAQSKQYTVIFNCPLSSQVDSSNTFLINMENYEMQNNENSYDTISVFAKEQISFCDTYLKKIVSMTGYPEFSDQLIPLIAGKDSMFYMEDIEYVSVRRGLFRRVTGTYPKKIKMPFSPESVLKENVVILRYLQQYYHCKYKRLLFTIEEKANFECWTKEEMNQLHQAIVDTLELKNNSNKILKGNT